MIKRGRRETFILHPKFFQRIRHFGTQLNTAKKLPKFRSWPAVPVEFKRMAALTAFSKDWLDFYGVLMKISEGQLVNLVRDFLLKKNLINNIESSFDDQRDTKADIELVLNSVEWNPHVPEVRLIIEAKSHHSKDSANTINKVFGQLMKETGKRSWNENKKSCLAILIPADRGTWKDSKKKNVNRPSGIEYYQEGFSRINPVIFQQYGDLLRARYILVYSVEEEALSVFSWNGFYERRPPIITFHK